MTPRIAIMACNAGVLPTPKDLILKTLEQVMDKEKCLPLLPALGGLSLREVGEVARLTHARDKTCTPAGLMKTRKSLFHGAKGITLVDTTSPLYWPRPEVAEYVKSNKNMFLDAPDPRLRPRGLLFKGTPGCGKTEGSRWIASQWGCPLYRLDATVQSKYVGESESFLQAALNQVSHEEPCVFLIVIPLVGSDRPTAKVQRGR
jgi:hypothetical protein